MKPGTEYELFVKQVYKMLLATDLPGCEVKHNVILTGHGGIEHQIDVYWEFEFAGVLYKTAVECKDYKNPVSKEKIAAFRAVLDDIGDVHGIYATRVGYQSGAKEFAKQHDIDILIIRHPEEKDWKDYVREVNITFVVQSVTNIRPMISIDSSRIDKDNIPAPNGESVFMSDAQAVILSYEKMKPEINAITMQDLINHLPRGEGENGVKKSYVYEFVNGYMDYNDIHWPIVSITFEYVTVSASHVLVVKANPDLLVYIQDIINDKHIMRKVEGGDFSGILQNQ